MIKRLIKEILIFFHLDLTKNLKYDRLTRAILKRLPKTANCIDVGCHKGEILDLILKHSPQGNHYAFEPIPHLFQLLWLKYKDTVQLFPFALADKSGKTIFHIVKNDLSYSGIKIRQYSIQNPEIEEITVAKESLDNLIPYNHAVDFIKIDVEGGEFDVIKGAKNLLLKDKPIVLFECGKGASDFYDTKPRDLYRFMCGEVGLSIYTLSNFLNHGGPLTETEFEAHFELQTEYYFVGSKCFI